MTRRQRVVVVAVILGAGTAFLVYRLRSAPALPEAPQAPPVPPAPPVPSLEDADRVAAAANEVASVADDAPLVELDPDFPLQLDPAEIAALAMGFVYPDSDEAAAAGAKAGERGHYTKGEFVTVCVWKTPRSAEKVTENTPAEIRSATRKAFRAEKEDERMRALTALGGVSVPTASALLHFAFPEDYPVLDKRAATALGQEKVSTSLKYWLRYLAACRGLAEARGVSVGTLDAALWRRSSG